MDKLGNKPPDGENENWKAPEEMNYKEFSPNKTKRIIKQC